MAPVKSRKSTKRGKRGAVKELLVKALGNGVYRLRAFHPDGGLAFVQRYLLGGVIDGEDTGFHPSGKIMYRAITNSENLLVLGLGTAKTVT